MSLPVFAEKELIRAPLRPSPSALSNNLACTDGNLVYAHNRSACILSPDSVTHGTTVTVRRGDSQAKDTIYSIDACYTPCGTYVVVGTDGGLQVWDKTCSTLMYVWTFPESDRLPSTSTVATFVRGAAAVQAADKSVAICFGSSSGRVYLMRVESGQFSTPQPFTHHTTPVTCVASEYHSRRGDGAATASSKVVTCDEAGAVSIWEVASSSDLKVSTVLANCPMPACAAAVRGDLLLLGRLDGAVHILSLSTGKVKAELTAHSRFLTTLALHPTKDVFATAAEDATINVWTLPVGDQKIQSIFSTLWMHAMPTGVSFCGAGDNTLAVVALDTEELRLYKAT